MTTSEREINDVRFDNIFVNIVFGIVSDQIQVLSLGESEMVFLFQVTPKEKWGAINSASAASSQYDCTLGIKYAFK